MSFNGFYLDPTNKELKRTDHRVVSLTPKAFAVLDHFVRHPSRLVPKNELLEAVWPKRYGGDAVLKVCVREIRKALGDDAKTPQFVETIHGRGYRFIANVAPPHVHTTDPKDTAAIPIDGVDSPILDLFLKPALPDPLVGRREELAHLGASLAAALQGKRQMVFVTGETGIGKSTLVDAFIHKATVAGGILATCGQCVEHHAEGSAYLPILEALSGLCQQVPTEVVSLLRGYAPSWLDQMPWIGNATECEVRSRVVRERMPLEFAEALQALTAQKASVLVLEDLQWSDHATLALLSFLAHRREPARLLIIGTYRSEDAWLSSRPIEAVKQDLQIHHQCTELALGFLGSDAVAEYLCSRLGVRVTAELVRNAHQHSNGNPLFLARMLDWWLAQGALRQVAGEWTLQTGLLKTSLISDIIRQMIEQKLKRLGRREQQVLETASVSGQKFSVGAVAAALDEDLLETEECCERLARSNLFLRQLHEPCPHTNRRCSQRFAFIHTISRHVLCGRVADARLVMLQQRFRAVYGERYFSMRQPILLND